MNADPGVQWMVRQVLLILRVLRDGLRALTHVLPPRRSNTCDERPVMFRLIWTISVRTRDYLHRYMPSNRLLAAIRTRRGLKWGIPAMLVALPYILIASICSSSAADGGPGWLHLIVLWACWNALKFIIMGPVSVVLLIRARLREAAIRRHLSRDSGFCPEADMKPARWRSRDVPGGGHGICPWGVVGHPPRSRLG